MTTAIPVAVRTLLNSLVHIDQVVQEFGLEGTGIVPCKYSVHPLDESLVPRDVVKELGPTYYGAEFFFVMVWLEGQAKLQGYVAKAARSPHNYWLGLPITIRSTKNPDFSRVLTKT
jgi:hypothetical protein